jgi:glycerol-3-phosphate dehydrogenase subunit B
MMATAPKQTACDLAIVGAGIAGLSAALFAAQKGVETVLIGETGEILFASGLMDLLAIHPLEEAGVWDDPWAAIDALRRDIPDHPYARMKTRDIGAAFDRLLGFLAEQGLPYRRRTGRNVSVLTTMGAVKRTYCVPETAWGGVRALEEKPSCLLVDFDQLRGFSARQIASTLTDRWPRLRTARIPFPGSTRIQYAEQLAQALEAPANREILADDIGACLGTARSVGLPAVLGLYRTGMVFADLQERIGVPLFEIPTLPPSVAGLRLRDAFHRGLVEMGVRLFPHHRVTSARCEQKNNFVLDITAPDGGQTIHAGALLLASGRFLGGGLRGDRNGIRETLLDLPVHQPEERAAWHRQDFLDPRGHPVNEAGLVTDDRFRPVGGGEPVHERLFAAGSVLAHQNWMRSKCGVGLSVATAYAAVNAYHCC